MSPKNQAQETSRHLKQRMFLVDLESSIQNIDVHKLDVTRLKKLNVNLCRVTLDQNSELKPHFFAPRHDIPQPSDEILDEACSPENPAFTDPYNRAYVTHIYWQSYAFHDVDFLDSAPWVLVTIPPCGSLYQYDSPAFGTFSTTDIAGGQFPHFKAVIYNDLEADNETCFRGELLIILRLMLGQLKKIRLLHHHKAPVLLISLAGKRARVLEAYFDEGSQSLIVRSSGLYGLSDRMSTSKTFKTLAEYYLGDLAGNTV
ncbi:hypothetical protein N7519_004137 [Penicillium mononematosum]|uniref:uncharacterized protein n=1 Tax=Penicillium mononematosum TaxID=268346 RepID=UPI00254879AE|nr:uncharacterized protein N7519_004137 [Penicillium mononematosum]KAJ6189229.1 hypothetical protein N7519_004137 [Penicillium mononematosum]